MKNQLAMMQLELPNMPLPMLKQLSLSEFEDLVTSKAWEKHQENDVDSARFEVLIKAISNAANAICKTLASGFKALASNR
ncbi:MULTISPECIES: hypothetical protein [Vitreoscilla]|uniref:Uncharacterized protein n=1 Tax=Vitreoscilla stercoraria TaxID=61 RepID=A0ABY4ECC8_VITST|nr:MULTISPECIES: hypothetical protein [Vitreoscilla]QJQ52281.1 hypothetical protein ADP71_40500 [Vitreoscilla sp. C1]UOO93376.1 hypothetical protein LVJ81_04935 [Vitreoscilla stercoraria]